MPELTRAYVKRRRSQWQVAKVATPEFGKDAFTFVRRLPSSAIIANADLFEKLEKSKVHPLESLAKLCTIGLCSKAGEVLYTMAQADELLEWPTDVLQRCAEKLIEFNGLNEDVKARAKNLPASRRVSSRSRSRKTSRKR